VKRLGGIRRLAARFGLAPVARGPPQSTVPPADDLEVRRLPGNPIIRPAMLPGEDGANINGPSLIRVPSWVDAPLGRYYLYFAHHKGTYIRLAYADRLDGPWKIHAPGVLHLEHVPACRKHVASPDVIVDDERRQLQLYFHGPARATTGQRSFVALSRNGLDFEPREEILGSFYFRVFRHEGCWYAMAKGGALYRSPDGLSGFEPGPNPFPGGELRTGKLNEPGPRHVAVLPEEQTLWVFYSSIGDRPERILRARMDLIPDWREWKAVDPVEVVRPQFDWEGADLPLRASEARAAKGREHALRDPAVFVDEDERRYLLYAVAGESGLAIAELVRPTRA
jgi:hypothetical protein